MSDQRIGGSFPREWNNYSQSAPTQTSNTPAPSSSQRVGSSQFGDLTPARQAAQHPATLDPGLVNETSAEWINEYRNSIDPKECELAGAVISAIQNGSLGLGNPESQTAMQAQYGQKLQTDHGVVKIVVNLRLRPNGRFDVMAAAMRNLATCK